MPIMPEDLDPDGRLVSNEDFAKYMAPIETALSDHAVAANVQACFGFSFGSGFTRPAALR